MDNAIRKKGKRTALLRSLDFLASLEVTLPPVNLLIHCRHFFANVVLLVEIFHLRRYTGAIWYGQTVNYQLKISRIECPTIKSLNLLANRQTDRVTFRQNIGNALLNLC